MKRQTHPFGLVPAFMLFIGLPLFFYAIGDFPRRSLLKESISVLTILGFCLMLMQFFLVRSNKNLLGGYKMGKVIKVHKFIGYILISILLLHPFLLVVPRFFEAGVDPVDGFITILSTYDNFGVVSGMVAWCMMLVLLITASFRGKIQLVYSTWRLVHGLLSIAFIVFASWHAIDLGRHTNRIFSAYILILATSGMLLLLKIYVVQPVAKARVSQ
ncbi:MAG: ferric reductase-like transmembrane domain-containing protein [Desulforhopalus sp.]